MPQKVRKAVFPVAGFGTRFLPETKSLPKEMLPVVDKPLIQYAVEEALAAGCEQMIFVTGRGKTAIVEHFDIAFELEKTMEERGKEFRERCFSSAVSPHQTNCFALLDRQRHPPQHRAVGVGEPNVLHSDRGHGE